MLQQNSYFPSRYFKWVKSSYTVELAAECILFCFVSVNYKGITFIPQISAVFFLLIIRIILAIKTQKTSIKKLVFTSRVKRLFSVAIIISLLLICGFYLFKKSFTGEICRMLCFMLSVVSPLLALICWVITYPVEKAVSKYYINDAKKILESHSNLTVIGITGSYGKTTTKFILNRILSEKYNTVCTPQSFNTPMGVVRTVRSEIKPQTQMFICEMGAKNIGDIKEICDIAHPSYAIITSVGPQHLETFKSVDNVFKTKFELADEVKRNGGKAFVSLESEGILSRYDKNDETLIGFGKSTDYRAENIAYGPDGSSFDLVLGNESIRVSTRLLGLHSISDIVAAAALSYMLGVPKEDIAFAVSSLKPTEHRLELKSFHNGSLLIDDAYNSNPEGCIGAVKVLSSFEGMKKVIITPGLIELGDKEYECNYNLGLEAAKYCDIIILVGKNRSKPLREAIETTSFNKESLYIVSSFKEAMQIYIPLADKTSVVLIENDLPDNYLN